MQQIICSGNLLSCSSFTVSLNNFWFSQNYLLFSNIHRIVSINNYQAVSSLWLLYCLNLKVELYWLGYELEGEVNVVPVSRLVKHNYSNNCIAANDTKYEFSIIFLYLFTNIYLQLDISEDFFPHMCMLEYSQYDFQTKTKQMQFFN